MIVIDLKIHFLAFFLSFMADTAKSFFKYFPFSISLEEWGFYALSCGKSSIPPNIIYPPQDQGHPDNHYFTWQRGRTLDSFTFVYIARGKGSFDSVMSGPRVIESGDMFILFPGHWHRYRPDFKTGWDEYWIEFSGQTAQRFFEKSSLEPKEPVFSVSGTPAVTDIFNRIMDVAETEAYGYEYVLASQAHSLLALLLSEPQTQIGPDREKIEAINKAKRILIEDLDVQIDLKKLAFELNMSYSLFRKSFKEMSGFSPHQYRLDFRLNRAMKLLESSDLQIGQIAARTGFKSIYYFSEHFKKKTGQSPLEYRKKNASSLAVS